MDVFFFPAHARHIEQSCGVRLTAGFRWQVHISDYRGAMRFDIGCHRRFGAPLLGIREVKSRFGARLRSNDVPPFSKREVQLARTYSWVAPFPPAEFFGVMLSRLASSFLCSASSSAPCISVRRNGFNITSRDQEPSEPRRKIVHSAFEQFRN